MCVVEYKMFFPCTYTHMCYITKFQLIHFYLVQVDWNDLKVTRCKTMVNEVGDELFQNLIAYRQFESCKKVNENLQPVLKNCEIIPISLRYSVDVFFRWNRHSISVNFYQNSRKFHRTEWVIFVPLRTY